MKQELASLSALQAARRLLGCELVYDLPSGERLRAKIVETEAYDQTDAASHSYNGRTPRTDVMFGPAGYLYVYFTYGMHYCANVVVGADGEGAAVLIRAVEPLEGQHILQERRGGKRGVELTNGPAKFCQAFGIDKSMNGHDLDTSPLRLVACAPLDDAQVVQTTRIGITKAIYQPWRFYIKNSEYAKT